MADNNTIEIKFSATGDDKVIMFKRFSPGACAKKLSRRR